MKDRYVSMRDLGSPSFELVMEAWCTQSPGGI